MERLLGPEFALLPAKIVAAAAAAAVGIGRVSRATGPAYFVE